MLKCVNNYYTDKQEYKYLFIVDVISLETLQGIFV